MVPFRHVHGFLNFLYPSIMGAVYSLPESTSQAACSLKSITASIEIVDSDSDTENATEQQNAKVTPANNKGFVPCIPCVL